MSDLSYTIEVKGVQDLDKLGNVVEKLTGTLNAGAGSGKALEELRKILIGIKGKGSALEELATAAKGFTDATAEMRKGISDNFTGLERLLKKEFASLKNIMQQGGAAAGMAAGQGVAQGMKDSAVVMEKEATALTKSAKANLKALQDDLSGWHAMLAAQVRGQHMRGKQATRMSIDDTRALLGMPDRDSMVQLAAQIKSQMQDALKTEGLRGRSATRMSIDDTRALLGMPDRDSMVQLAAQIKSQMQESMAKEKLRASSASKMTEEDTRALFGLPSRAEMKTFAAQLKAQMRDAVQSAPVHISKTDLADMKYTEAMSGMRAYYQEQEKASTSSQGFFARLREGGAAMDEAGKKGTALGRVFRAMTVDGNDAHSMARGLASGFNLLWLTWGNLAPLFAGAAISYGVKSVVSMGADVQNTMETIRVLSEETTVAVAGLNTQLLELARSGPFGPLAIAEAMKTMSLAGLSAGEVSTAIKDVMNFAVAGTTDLKTAADVMTSVSTAFGIAATGYNYVGDIIAKTAAVSKSSVESIGEAFKTASVINKQYGVSLEDVGVGLAALSNLGIQGSAAGTALRNMYADLSERTPKVAKALKSVGVQLRDNAGNFKDVITITAEMGKAMDNMQSNLDKKAFLRDVLSERGAKPFIELLDLAKRTAAETGSTVETELERLKARILDSAGFMANAAAEMAMTPLNQMKSVTSSLQATLVEAFNGLAPVILEVSARLKEAFASEEFKSALQTLIGLISKLTLAVVENIEAIGKLAAAFALFKGFQMLLGVFNGIAMGVAGLTAAFTGATIAATAATGFFTRLIGLFNPIGAAIAVAATAWQVYSFYSDKGKKATEDQVKSGYHDELVKKLEEETKRLNENTEAMRLNMTVDELRASRESRRIQDAAQDSRRAAISGAQSRISSLQATYNMQAAQPAANTAAGASHLAQLNKKIEAARDDMWRLVDANMKEDARLQTARENLADAGRANAEEARRQAALRKEFLASQLGDNPYTPVSGRPGGGFTPLTPVSTAKQNLMKETEEANRNELASIKSHYDSKQRLLKSQGDNQLILQAEFLTREIGLTQESEAKQLQVLSEGAERYTAAYEAQTEALSASYSEWMAKNPKATAEQVDKQLQDTQTAMLNLGREYNTTVAKMKQDAGAIKDNAFERLQLSINKAKGELRALERAFEAFWDNEAMSAAAKKRATAMEDQMRFATPKQVAVLQAMSDEFERWQSEIDRTQLELKKLNKEYEWYQEHLALGNLLSAEQQNNLDLVIDKMEKYRNQIDKLRKAQKEGTEQASFGAALKYNKDEFKKVRDDLADAIATGLFEGGKEGQKKLKDLLKSAFRNFVLNVFINPMVQGGMNYFVGNGSNGGGGGGALGTLSDINTIGGAAVQAYGGFTAGASTASLAYANGVGLVGGDALGALISANGGWAGVGAATAAESAIAANLAMEAGTGVALESGTLALAAEGAGASSAMSSIAAAAPYIAAIIAVVSLLAGLDDSGTFHTGGAGAAGKSGIIPGIKAESLGFADTVVSDEITKSMQDMATGFSDLFNGLDKGDFTVSTAFADDTSKDGAWGAFRIERNGEKLLDWQDTQTSRWAPKEFADGSEGFKQYTAALAVSVRDALTQIGLPEWATDILKAFGDAPTFEQISGVMGAITQVDLTMKTLGMGMTAFADISDETVSKLAEATGGIAALQQRLSYFYQEFFSEADRVKIASSQTTDKFKELGQQMPKTRDEFKGMVNAALEAGDTDLASKLLALSGAIASIYPAVEDATQAAENLKDQAMKQLEAAISREKTYWQNQADAAESLRSEIESIFDMLRDAVIGLREDALGPAAAGAQGAASINQMLAAAQATGVLPDADTLSTAIGQARGGMGLENFASVAEQRYAQMELAGKLESLQFIAGDQLSEAERQILVAQNQLETLDATLNWWQTVANDNMVEQINATMSVTDAINQLADILDPTGAKRGLRQTSANGNYIMGGAGGYGRLKDGTDVWFNQDHSGGTYRTTQSSGGGYQYLPGLGSYVSASSQDMHGDLSHLAAAQLTYAFNSPETDQASTLAKWVNGPTGYGSVESLMAAVGSLIDPGVAHSYGTIPGYASGGVHSGGLAIVGEDGAELVDMGPSRIHNSGATADLLDNTALRAEMAAMREEMQNLNTLMEQMLVQATRTANATNGLGEAPMNTAVDA